MPQQMSEQSLLRTATVLAALKQKKLAIYEPYDKQAIFHALGAYKRERCLMAGNQLGKTLSAGMELSFHTTGIYPEWWTGKRFPSPQLWWAANTNNETTRDGPQTMLMGETGSWGTGTIPASCITKKPTMSRGFPDLIDTLLIKHITGGNSVIQFKGYDQGVKKFAGRTLSGGLWLDEEPPKDVYSECLARISATDGIIMLTMTPLLGISDVVGYFFPEPNTDERALIQFEIYDVNHMDDEMKAKRVAAYPDHERDARTRGYPMLGEGRVFAVPQTAFECKRFEIPSHFRQIGGIDFGYGDHPFAGAKAAYDSETDCLYITNTHKDHDPKPPMHVAALKAWGDDLIFHWPHDGHRQWGDSGPVADVYKHAGLKMYREHATFKSGGYSPEAAVTHILSRMQTGRFKIFEDLTDLFLEISMYHRKDGKLVQKKDDILSAVFKIMMMLRFARVPIGHHGKLIEVGTSWDEFGGDEYGT